MSRETRRLVWGMNDFREALFVFDFILPFNSKMPDFAQASSFSWSDFTFFSFQVLYGLKYFCSFL